MRRFSKSLFIFLLAIKVFSAEDLQIDEILNTLPIKDDLSNKTKIENGGISYIYTREDIRKMQAHTLNDILKSTYPFGYNENRFGLPDPYYSGTSLPFASSHIRIYIDDQEITNGLYGSGIIVYGDLDIDFVDHIEVYSGNPTFEFSSEPAFTIIKLYSKIAQKDDGSKISTSVGSRGANYLYMYDTQELENGWSYFTYVSNSNLKREKYQNYDSTLSRDSKTTHIFGSFYDENDKVLIDGMVQNRDIFIANSVFATPKSSNADEKYLHVGYNGSRGELSFIFTFDEYDGKSIFEDDNQDLIKKINELYDKSLPYNAYLDFDSQSYTAGVKYNIKTTNNKFLMGLKYRYKHFTFNNTIINDEKKPDNRHTVQTISTIFFENQYNISTNKILTVGSTLVDVQNNNSPQDDNLLSYRVGYTYTNKNLTSKTIVSHIETTLDPYLVDNPMYLQYPDQKTEITTKNIFMQDFKYKNNNNLFELIGSYMLLKDKLLLNEEGKLETYKDTVSMKSLLGRYTREYNRVDKLEMTLGVNYLGNMPYVNHIYQYSFTASNFTTYKKFDIFNEFLCYRDSIDKKTFCDYSAGIIYRYNEDLHFALKGTNLLDSAKESKYSRISPTDLTQETPLSISPIDRTILFTVEYTF